MNTQEYDDFLFNKLRKVEKTGFDIDLSAINSKAFPFQSHIIQWALKMGRAAIFADCGLGKTLMQTEWAKHVAEYTDKPVLILAPLAVSLQTVKEGEKFGIPIKYVREQAEVVKSDYGVYITNYEILEHFDPSVFGGVVLDESSVLKAYTGKTKTLVTKLFKRFQFKLSCSATPAPNVTTSDYLELGNQAEFLEVVGESNEMIAEFFINDTMGAGKYRLKNHSRKAFWEWVTKWAVAISKPSDLGFSDDGFILPELKINELVVPVDHTRAFEEGKLFLDSTLSATSMWKEKRETAKDRCQLAYERYKSNYDGEFCSIWCDTDAEQDELENLFGDLAFSLRGKDSTKKKEQLPYRWIDGERPIIITKVDIFGWGMNWQHCHNTIFVGANYSFEKGYQGLSRHHRFGQKHTVNADFIFAESETNIMKTWRAKQAAHRKMQLEANRAMQANGLSRENGTMLETLGIVERMEQGKNWTLYKDDCVHSVSKMEDNSIDFSVFSPPFSTLYIYSDNIADMGNCRDNNEFFEQFKYLIKELHRVIKPGRLVSVHCKDLPLYMNRDGAAGLYDFPGDCIRRFEQEGFTFHSRVTIWKDPVIEMQRTKNHGLLYKNFRQRGEVSRAGMADYVLTFRKWEGIEGSESEVPVTHDTNRYPLEVWQRWASPVWMDIDQTNVLNFRLGKDNEDEKHICPLQLDVIERLILLYTNPGEVVLTPFGGVGSEPVVALRLGRKAVAVELKDSYFDTMVKFVKEAEQEAKAMDMFDVLQSENA